MDNQSTDCAELQDADDREKNTSPSPNADDRKVDLPIDVTQDLNSDQSHITQHQEETMELKVDVKSLCGSGGLAKSMDKVHMTLLRSSLGLARYDPVSHFSNASIVSGSENRNTHRKTGADMRILGMFLRSLNESRPPEAIPPSELDKYLSSFFLRVRKTDGSDYEPCSLRAMLASIERYLRQKNYPTSLTRDEEFTNMRNVLKLKQQMLRSIGKGQKSAAELSQSGSIREGKMVQLFQAREMGPYSPNSVLFSMCFFICVYLKLRKSTEHKKLLWGDIILCKDCNDREYLAFSAQMLNKIHASQRLSLRLANAKIWSEPDIPDRDPVALYKFYTEKRPLTMNQPHAPFYLGLNLVSPLPGQCWYRPAALGINKLNEMVRQIRDLTSQKSADTNTLPYIPPAFSQETLPIVSELSNASSDPSSSRDGHNVDSSDFDGREVTPGSSPRLTIDMDDVYSEPVGTSTSVDQPLSLVRETENSDEQSLKSPNTLSMRQESLKGSESLLSTATGAADEGDAFQHQVATMNAARIRELYTQSSEAEEAVSDEEEGDFIGIEQAKELVTDIIRRMDIIDMVQFDRWLKSMTIGRDAISGQVMCKDPHRYSSTNKYSAVHNIEANDDHIGSETSNMNILLNIALTPNALRGQGPVTVQATAVSTSDVQDMSTGHGSHSRMFDSEFRNRHSHLNGDASDSDSPLDLALSSLRGTSGSASGSHNDTRINSSRKHSTPSSLAGAAGECSPAKQVRGSCGQYEGRRRKLNPAFLTHIKPRSPVNDGDKHDRTSGSVSAELDESLTFAYSDSVDDEDLVHVLNLKQEIE